MSGAFVSTTHITSKCKSRQHDVVTEPCLVEGEQPIQQGVAAAAPHMQIEAGEGPILAGSQIAGTRQYHPVEGPYGVAGLVEDVPQVG